MPRSARFLLIAAMIMVMSLPAFAQKRQSSSSGGPSSSSNLPTAPPVNPQLMKARADVTKAQTALDTLTAKLTSDYEASDEYTAAKKALADAADALNAAKVPVLAALKDAPEYKGALADEADAAKKLADLKASDSPRTQINAANDDLFKLSAVNGKLETQAYAADPGVQSAQTALQTAKENLNKLKTGFKASLPENADYAAAKKTLDDAQTKLASLAPKPNVMAGNR